MLTQAGPGIRLGSAPSSGIRGGGEGLTIDARDLAAQLLAGDIEDQPPDVQRLIRYIWARVALDFGILVLIGEEHVNGIDRLICALQDDGSSYVVERPPGWSLDDEARYVAPVKEYPGWNMRPALSPIARAS